jgi:hypothetical protein
MNGMIEGRVNVGRLPRGVAQESTASGVVQIELHLLAEKLFRSRASSLESYALRGPNATTLVPMRGKSRRSRPRRLLRCGHVGRIRLRTPELP